MFFKKNLNKNVINLFASPLEGEAAFQCEQRIANIKKAGEGNCMIRKTFNPSPEFLKLIPRFEILPSPSRGEGKQRWMFYFCQTKGYNPLFAKIVLSILIVGFCFQAGCFAGNGVFSQKTVPIDKYMPYPPYPMYPSGLSDSDNAIYRYAEKSSNSPVLMLVDPIYDNDRNVILPGYYSLILSDDRSYFLLAQGDVVVASIPVFKVEEDKEALAKLHDKKYQRKLAKKEKEEAKINAKKARQGVPAPEKTVHMDASIEYQQDKKYYLIKYERDRIRAWGSIGE